MTDRSGATSVDVDLVRRAQEGDTVAFGKLAVGIGDRLYSLAARMLRDPGLAEDASQQALLTIWQQLPRLRDPVRFEGWCYRILVNTCHGEWRRRKKALGDPATPLPLPDPRADAELASVADRDELEGAFARLSMDHRVVVVMRYYLDYPIATIAELLGIPARTASSRLYHAMRGLRSALEADARLEPDAAATNRREIG